MISPSRNAPQLAVGIGEAINCFTANIDYFVNMSVADYNVPIVFDEVVVPNSVYIGTSTDSARLRSLTQATTMLFSSNYYRYLFYPVKNSGETNFTVRETLPADFTFASSPVLYKTNGTSIYNCTVSASGLSYAFNSSNCALLGQQASPGDWLLVKYQMLSPAPDAFFTITKDYNFSMANLTMQYP